MYFKLRYFWNERKIKLKITAAIQKFLNKMLKITSNPRVFGEILIASIEILKDRREADGWDFTW